MGEWSADMGKIKALTSKKMTKVLRIAVMETTKDIIMDTPVDTGRLRGNWQAGIGNKTSGQLDLLDPSGMVTFGRISSIIGPLKHDQTLVFYNNLIYAVPVEYGHSKEKSPRGMVRKNLVNWGSRVVRISKVVKNEKS